MSSKFNPLAGTLAPLSSLINVMQLINAYFEDTPDPSIMAQRGSFDTQGHRGCAFDGSFNEWHVLAITQAICNCREYGWFAVRPSGTEDIYKIYGESFRDEEHLRRIASDAQAIIKRAVAANASLL